MILIVGATGLLGAEICSRLRAQAHPTRALVRKGSPRESLLRGLDVEIVYGDLKDRHSLDAACCGASVVITTANSVLSRRHGDSLKTVDRDGSLALLRAAEAAGSRHFVYVSVSPSLSTNNPFVRYKRQVEAAVRKSCLTWTILQPAAFMEIHAGAVGGWDYEAGRARLMGSGRAPISYISAADVAAFAVAAVDNPAAANRELHITGPEPLTALEAVAIAEKVTGRAFKVQRIPVGALRVFRALLRPFHPAMSSLLAIGISMEQGDRVTMEPLLREFAVQPTTFEQYVLRNRTPAVASLR
jgi:uncharacterized protein YbjT (DUF2867 family)